LPGDVLGLASTRSPATRSKAIWQAAAGWENVLEVDQARFGRPVIT
jgi:hypothetical protein